MNNPYKVSRVTTVVGVSAVLSGEAPAIKVVYSAKNSRGAARQFVRQVSVPDALLFERLQASVKEGDQIEVTTVNEWYDVGYTSYLADFKKMPDLGTKVANGTINFTTNSITEVVVPPARDAETIRY